MIPTPAQIEAARKAIDRIWCRWLQRTDRGETIMTNTLQDEMAAAALTAAAEVQASLAKCKVHSDAKLYGTTAAEVAMDTISDLTSGGKPVRTAASDVDAKGFNVDLKNAGYAAAAEVEGRFHYGPIEPAAAIMESEETRVERLRFNATIERCAQVVTELAANAKSDIRRVAFMDAVAAIRALD